VDLLKRSGTVRIESGSDSMPFSSVELHYIRSSPPRGVANVSSFSRANYLTERFGHCKDPLSESEHCYRKSLHNPDIPAGHSHSRLYFRLQPTAYRAGDAIASRSASNATKMKPKFN